MLSNAFEREALIDISFKIAHDLSIIPSSRPLVLDCLLVLEDENNDEDEEMQDSIVTSSCTSSSWWWW